MTTLHCSLVLHPTRSALPRVVSALHSRGLEVRHLHTDGTAVCLLVAGPSAPRLPAVLGRVVDVVDVEVTPNCLGSRLPTPRQPTATRYLVTRQDLRPTG